MSQLHRTLRQQHRLKHHARVWLDISCVLHETVFILFKYERRSENIRTFHAPHVQLPTRIIHEQKLHFIAYKSVSLLSVRSVYTRTFEHWNKVGVRATMDYKLKEWRSVIKFLILRGTCKKFCHWVRITSVLRFIKHIFITNLQSIPPLLKHIFVTLLPGREKQINSLLLVSVGDTDK